MGIVKNVWNPVARCPRYATAAERADKMFPMPLSGMLQKVNVKSILACSSLGFLRATLGAGVK